MSGISLTSSMRNNLLSLQQTAKLQDLTQNRLATGLKVNSAIDNPSSYYTAQSLNNRAEDLNVLLDAMSQGIQTLKAVNESIEAGTKFLEQAKSVASSALETAQPVVAKVSTEAELLAAVNSGKKGLIVLTSDITMSTNQNIVLNDGQSLVGARYLDKNAAATTLKFNFTTTDSAIGIETAEGSLISGLNIDYTSAHKTTFFDFHAIRNQGHHVTIENVNINIDSADTSSNFISGIHTGSSGETILNGTVNIKSLNPNSHFLYGISAADETAVLTQKAGSTLNIYTTGDHGHGIRNGTNNFNGIVNISLGSSTDEVFGLALGNYNLGSSSQLNITNRFTINPQYLIYDSALTYQNGASVSVKLDGAALNDTWIAAADGSIGKSSLLSLNSFPDWNRISEFPQAQFDNIFNDFDAYMDASQKVFPPRDNISETASRFNQILTQYDNLINDSWYKGVNLLKSQDLKVVFNESRTSDLDIKGVDATTSGLGLETADWSNADYVQNSLDQIDSAINQLRLYTSEFGNYYQIVTTRENFTNSLINVLTEGADQLTLADMNQESANMLALQTRQQLAVNSLSLASQASQSVLKLF